ncbi:unnamed protein product [marine sediment metagenome]|uniref:Ankyrin repeat protein n=1 Tax=marine sediment metagenome TaxID=412755 RepID=X1DU26_9ZZZZ
MPRLNKIFKPKNLDEIIETLNGDPPSYFTMVNVLIRLMRDDIIGEKKLLLDIIEKIDTKPALEHLLINSCIYNSVEAAEIILDKDLIDPSINNNRPLKLARQHQSFKIIQLLLRDERVRKGWPVIEEGWL